MKKTALALLTFTILGGAAQAQSQQPGSPAITPPATSTSITTTKSTTTDVVMPAEDAKTHNSVLEDVSNDDPLNPTPGPLDPAAEPMDSRDTMSPAPTVKTTPLTPTVTPDPLITPVKGADKNATDVSSIESNLEFTPVLNYDTDSDGMLDTRELLDGPVYPQSTRVESTTEIRSTTTEIEPELKPMP